MENDVFKVVDDIVVGDETYKLYSLEKLEKSGFSKISSLPFSIKVLLEQALRNLDSFQVNKKDIETIASWDALKKSDNEIPFKPTRVILQDLTGVPSLVDLASLRSSMADLGGDPSVINPKVPVDLIIDHSVQVDEFGTSQALEANIKKEFERNKERYEFLKWGQQAFKNLRVFPPGFGIVHQVNLENLATVVQNEDGVCFSDTLVGTDSHTPMINGLGVLGWGVGGIEAESVMLGQPIFMTLPQVVGFKITGSLNKGTTATDLVLRVTELLRSIGVVEKFVEFYGDGLSNLSLADRATISNMAPEYGATIGFFPTDDITLDYMKGTGRSDKLIQLVSAYSKKQGIFRTDGMAEPAFSQTVELDLSTIEPSLAGPKRPQDRIALSGMQTAWKKALKASVQERGFELSDEQIKVSAVVNDGGSYELSHGAVVIAAITSCTNTSNPSVMIAAGLLAKKATELGLTQKPWVKTSLAPGSRVVTDYLEQSGLAEYLEKLGFYTVGYGCTSCIGNSGPLPEPVLKAIQEKDLVVSSVLSGNRNFEGRVNPYTKANYLASPPLVVAYAIAGTVDIDLSTDPIGYDQQGGAVYLNQIWPDASEVAEVVKIIQPEMYHNRYSEPNKLSPLWNEIEAKGSEVFNWDDSSTYIRNPPFFSKMTKSVLPISEIKNARVLVKVGDSVTTDHISPAGAISEKSAAADYLKSKGVTLKEFNSYGSRRGNDQVMVRGTFANVRMRNQLVAGVEGGYTKMIPSGEQMYIFDAAERYQSEAIPLVVLSGKEYGAGSSRDWAAKGTYLLGIKAVIAESYERIHRSNLLGMGVLPLQFMSGDSAESLGLTGEETISILGLSDDLQPRQELIAQADGKEFKVLSRLDTPVEIQYFKNGGILHTVLRNFIEEADKK